MNHSIIDLGILESMLSLETVAHEFDPAENIDVFTSPPGAGAFRILRVIFEPGGR
jgi:hypothetical protein